VSGVMCFVDSVWTGSCALLIMYGPGHVNCW